MDDPDLHEIRDAVQDCNINLLMGAGTSSPFLKLLGNVEKLLTDLSNLEINPNIDKIVRASIYAYFFDECLSKNLDLIENSKSAQAVLDKYKDFLKSINYILLKRKSSILSKQVNVFTTNVDVFLEKAFENTRLEYNDGFSGRFEPTFSLSNFKKSQFKKSLHYDNTSEMPVFNLMKLHGSLTWRVKDDESITFTSLLENVKAIKKCEKPDSRVEVADQSTAEELVKAASSKTLDQKTLDYMNAYDKLAIINPNKEKFMHSLMNQTYYELLRIFSNELEKENTILFAAGFSFADEHIREVTLRAANSNPTLMIYIFAYSNDTRKKLEKLLDLKSVKNKNVKIMAPHLKKNKSGKIEEPYKYDLKNITDLIFNKLLPRQETDKVDFQEPATLETS